MNLSLKSQEKRKKQIKELEARKKTLLRAKVIDWGQVNRINKQLDKLNK